MDQANRDPDQYIDPTISTLNLTLDLICLVPPREPDYLRWRNHNHEKADSQSLSSGSSISQIEKTVRFENVDGGVKSVSISVSHDRESR